VIGVLRVSLALGAALTAIASAGHADATDDAVARDAPYAQAEQLVDVDHGRRLNLYCVGEGSPTVVFDAGLGGNTASWDTIQPVVAQKTRTCSFDRAGLGFSDPATRPSTSANAVDDLQRLLSAAGIKPPYILVGHSAGGLDMRLYAYDHPAEVVGMVLVDPSHEDDGPRAWQIEGPDAKAKWEQSNAHFLEDRRQCVAAAQARQLVPGSALYKQCMPLPVAHWSDAMNRVMLRHSAEASNQRAVLSENEDFDTASADELRAARHSLGDMPLIVLTRAPALPGPDQTQEQRDQLNKLWMTLHDEIAAESTRGVNLAVPYSGHFIQWDQPQVVVDTILGILVEARKGTPPASTGVGGH
jgi:pimeloyl-ACP methyl ester carboxylesterase